MVWDDPRYLKVADAAFGVAVTNATYAKTQHIPFLYTEHFGKGGGNGSLIRILKVWDMSKGKHGIACSRRNAFHRAFYFAHSPDICRNTQGTSHFHDKARMRILPYGLKEIIIELIA